ncbi:hypothetical protein B0F90DRAFT_1339261 [Multifurca ochricompacta]|uniref:Uncharacterized protein n=1 Tax=Multifurca ochricompacta TaxID=376703 RepID=A0AAD4QKH2_9AGAM|nr:hypothetical protein B0F90DRAFT_1339261 [Multifurca ochricompacta]
MLDFMINYSFFFFFTSANLSCAGGRKKMSATLGAARVHFRSRPRGMWAQGVFPRRLCCRQVFLIFYGCFAMILGTLDARPTWMPFFSSVRCVCVRERERV